MSSSLDASAYHNLLRSFLAEDVGTGDITTEMTVPAKQRAHGEVIAKAPLVLAGIELFAEVFRLLDSTTVAQIFSHDGEELAPGKIPACVRASARALLTGERVALNLLQRLSGVATLTRKFVRAIEGTSAHILDTRKTTPGLRRLEKDAVQLGGGHNHRFGLSDGILIKDNHIKAAGGIAQAVSAARKRAPHLLKIEVECETLAEVRTALEARAEVVLLDNMDVETMRNAVSYIRQHAPNVLIEASGSIG